MVIADHCTGGGRSEANNGLPATGCVALIRSSFGICFVLCALTIAGCARNPVQPAVNVTPLATKAVSAHAPVQPRRYLHPIRYSEPLIRRPDPLLLVPQTAPDCEFKKTDIAAMDPQEWSRLKVEYERSCYRDAEKAARARLSLLQEAGSCEIERIRKPDSTPRPSRQSQSRKLRHNTL
jgi:hypothetical protein